MLIYFAGDHAGFELKRELINFVRSLGHEAEDLGPLEPKAGDDYPDYVIPLAKKVAGARAALFCPCNLDLIKASRDHNDSNIFAIGARFCTEEQAKEAVNLWLETPFSNDERHIRRLRKIEELASS